MILPIYNGGASGIVDSARIYIQGMLDRFGEGYFAQFFTQSFFQANLLKSIMQPGSWRMDDSYDLADNGTSAFHVYHFIPCLRLFAAHPPLLPPQGVTCLELKPLLSFIFTWFRSMDVAQGFETARFDSSILGCRLRFLIALLEKHPVQTLWATNARTMSYVWFKSLRQLLYLFQRLSSISMWKTGGGFLPANPHVHIDPYNRDGQHFIDLVQEYDADLLVQWSRDRLRSSESFYNASTIPASHFMKAPSSRSHSTGPSQQDQASLKPKATGNKRSANAMNPDFISIKPLFELANAPTNEKGVFQQLSAASPQGTCMPVLTNPDGKSALICFSSAVGSPFNKCNLANCIRKTSSRRPYTFLPCRLQPAILGQSTRNLLGTSRHLSSTSWRVESYSTIRVPQSKDAVNPVVGHTVVIVRGGGHSICRS